MILYTLDGYKYTGMDSNTVLALREELGKSTIFVDQTTYEAYIASHSRE